MSYFGNGSKLSMPLLLPNNMPLNALEVADNVAQVLSALPEAKRYVGQAIFCEDENKLYRFTKHDDGTGNLTSGVLDSDFREDKTSVNTDTLIEVVLTLPTAEASVLGKYVLLTTDDTVYKCMINIDGATYEWKAISNDVKIPEYETGHDYVVNEVFQYNNVEYRVIKDFTSTVFEDDTDNFITRLNYYYNLSKTQYEGMVNDGLITDENKHLFIVNDDNTDNKEYFTTTSPITNKIGQFDLNEEYNDLDKVTINEALNKILHVNTEPEITLETVGIDSVMEIGQTVSVVNLRLAFTNVGNGNITNIQFYKNDIELGSSQSFVDGTLEYTNDEDRNLSTDATYKVIVTYNFGKGDKTVEKEVSCKFTKRSFYGTTQNISFVLDSTNIRALSGNKLGLKKGDKFNINISSGDVQVIIAYPKEIGDISSIKYVEGMNAEIKDVFTSQVVQVEDLGTTLTDYNVYVYKPINSYSKDATYVVTI